MVFAVGVAASASAEVAFVAALALMVAGILAAKRALVAEEAHRAELR